jgi:hypothetical protein
LTTLSVVTGFGLMKLQARQLLHYESVSICARSLR